MLRKPLENTSPSIDPGIVQAINEIGDAWLMLILWACDHGVTRFDAFQRELGVARNILSERLRRLVQSGLVEKAPIADGARRMEYRLTEKGRSIQPVLQALAEWARENIETEKAETAAGGGAGLSDSDDARRATAPRTQAAE